MVIALSRPMRFYHCPTPRSPKSGVDENPIQAQIVTRMRLAKTSIPILARVVPRKRLFGRLDTASSHRFVWVSGPPGAGKTTLVASWIFSRRLHCLWYRVDPSDADLGSFFFHLAQATDRGSRPVRAMQLPRFGPEYLGSEAAFARRFFRAIAARRKRKFVLVFDDLGTLPPDAPLFVALREGLEELAGAARAVLISREAPPRAFARLLANGALETVIGDELLLSRAEALAIGRAHARREIQPQEIARACERAAGWTAGIVLLLRGGGRGTPDATPPLFDYLAGEFFESEDPEERCVLECAALLSEVPVKVVTGVCGSEGAEAILNDLARRAYFTVRRGTSDAAFELHPLFREFLLARLNADRTRDEIRALRLRAARALEEAGYLEQAIALLIEAQGWNELIRICLAIAPLFHATGRARSLETWIRAIPKDLRAQRPWLLYWLGECRGWFDPEDARRHIRQAYAGFERAGDVQGQYAACSAAIDTILIEWSDFTEMDEWLDRLEALRTRGVVPSSRELELRVTVSTFGAMTFHRNDNPALLDWEERVLDLVADTSVPLFLRALLGAWFLVESAMRGENARAAPVVRSLAPQARAPAVDPPTTLAWLTGESAYHWHTGSASEASLAVSTGLELARESGVRIWDFNLHLQGMFASLADEDVDRARAFLASAKRVLKPGQPLNAAVVAHAEGLLALRVGDTERAIECGRGAAATGERGAMPFFRCLGELMLALAATATGDVAAARRSIGIARDLGSVIQSHLPRFLCDLCDAELARRAGDRASACDHLRRAFRLAREKMIVPDVWLSPAQLGPLCALALEANIEPDHVRELIRRLHLEPPETARGLESWPWRVRVRLLGSLEATVAGSAIRFAGEARRRPLEIVAALVALGRPESADAEVANVLWPASDGDLAHHALETALYRLRRLLGEGVVVHRDRMLAIDLRNCWVDALAFDALMARASAALQRNAVAEAIDSAERAIGVYRGPFLPNRDEPWVIAARTRLRRPILRVIGDFCRHAELASRAEDLLARASRADASLREGEGARWPALSDTPGGG
jgi:LuxR family transcriptional regulator, maltose regulon positive regulatory protein